MAMNPLRTVPDPGTNNVWYSYGGSDTVLIFLHGIFSDSRGCWMYREPQKSSGIFDRKSKPPASEIYWPDLVANDPNFAGVDVFLAGFYTSIDATDYDLADCATEVYENLTTPRYPADKPVMVKKNLIFVGHSTGGIVARSLLANNQPAFQDKNVGVVLIASPSTGSVYADLFSFLAKVYKNELGGVLRTDSTLLSELDNRFSAMVTQRAAHIPNLKGAEACEHHMVLRKALFGRVARWIPPLVSRRVVDPKSAGRYFRPARKIPDSDHFSVVKPPSVNHQTHSFLHTFWYQFQQEFLADSATKPAIAKPLLLPPRLTEEMVGRDDLLIEMRQRISNRECALYGPAGVGKTFLAHWLIGDDQLRAAYPDGVLYGSLLDGEDAGTLLASWADALGISQASIAQLKRIDDRAAAVANAIGDRKMLLVCDNCDSQEDAVVIRGPGRNCARLLTTRSREVAITFTRSGAIEIPPLSEDAAYDLLLRITPSLRGETQIASEVIALLGRAPGPIVTIGRMLSQISSMNNLKEIVRRIAEEQK